MINRVAGSLYSSNINKSVQPKAKQNDKTNFGLNETNVQSVIKDIKTEQECVKKIEEIAEKVKKIVERIKSRLAKENTPTE